MNGFLKLTWLLPCFDLLLVSFVDAASMHSVDAKLRECLVTRSVVVAMTVLREALWRRLEIRTHLSFIHARSWIRCWSRVSSSDARIYSGVTSSLASTIKARISCPTIEDNCAWVSCSWLSVVVQMRVVNRLVRSVRRATSWTSARLTNSLRRREHITWLHVRKDLGEALTVSRNSLTWVSERQFLPCIEVHSLSVHIYEVLLARCTRLWSQMTFAEHSILFIVSAATLSRQQVHDFSNLLTKLGESFHNIIFVGKLVENLLDHFSQFIKQPILEIN